MKFEYQFELVFIKLRLKTNILSDSLLRISLIDTNKQLNASSKIVQSEEMRLKKFIKIVELDVLPAFKFNVFDDRSDDDFIIKYEVKANSQEINRNIPVKVAKMIKELEETKSYVFEDQYAGQKAQLFFKFFIAKNQVEDTNNLDVPLEVKQNHSRGSLSPRSSGKRPPSLKVKNRSIPKINTDRSNQKTEKEKEIIGNTTNSDRARLNSALALSPNQEDQPSREFSTYRSLQTNLNKKVATIPESQLEKVNELISTHHRRQETTQNAISYKIKIVIAMLIIGILFLIFDTLSDRNLRTVSNKKTRQKIAHQNDQGKGKKGRSKNEKRKERD